MFDAVSGDDGSGIVYVRAIETENPSVSNTIHLGDTVELFVNGEGVFVIVTDFLSGERLPGKEGEEPGQVLTGALEGVVTDIPAASINTGLEIAEVIRFGLANISRCFQSF
ncbi:hypothetical protein [Hahella ganghwensis]|uniref:hypothetical protein n=1 Tax=Hahella ganghwensis TaxID=286420 RepID=UPI000374C1B2|nr:hypothetical protein [Hahella ganghwensis]